MARTEPKHEEIRLTQVWNGREKGTVHKFGYGVMQALVDWNVAEWVETKPKRKRIAVE